MLWKVNVSAIVRAHFRTLRRPKGDRMAWDDWSVFVIAPSLAATALTYGGVRLTDAATNGLLTALSIFAGLLFNLLLLAHGLVRRNEGGSWAPHDVEMMREIYNNISYSILLSVFTLVALLLVLLLGKQPLLLTCVSWIVFAAVANFLVTLLMILKRIHFLLTHDFEAAAHVSR